MMLVLKWCVLGDFCGTNLWIFGSHENVICQLFQCGMEKCTVCENFIQEIHVHKNVQSLLRYSNRYDND